MCTCMWYFVLLLQCNIVCTIILIGAVKPNIDYMINMMIYTLYNLYASMLTSQRFPVYNEKYCYSIKNPAM